MNQHCENTFSTMSGVRCTFKGGLRLKVCTLSHITTRGRCFTSGEDERAQAHFLRSNPETQSHQLQTQRPLFDSRIPGNPAPLWAAGWRGDKDITLSQNRLYPPCSSVLEQNTDSPPSRCPAWPLTSPVEPNKVFSHQSHSEIAL